MMRTTVGCSQEANLDVLIARDAIYLQYSVGKRGYTASSAIGFIFCGTQENLKYKAMAIYFYKCNTLRNLEEINKKNYVTHTVEKKRQNFCRENQK